MSFFCGLGTIAGEGVEELSLSPDFFKFKQINGWMRMLRYLNITSYKANLPQNRFENSHTVLNALRTSVGKSIGQKWNAKALQISKDFVQTPFENNCWVSWPKIDAGTRRLKIIYKKNS